MVLLAVLACQVELAPAGESFDDDVELRGRTELGDRVVVDAPDDVSTFAEHLAVIRGELVVTEAAAGPCDRRLRKLELADLTDAELVNCPVSGDPSFGTSLSGADVQTVTGDQVLRYTSPDGRLPDELDGAAGPFNAVVLDEWRTMVADPASNAVHAFVHSNDLRFDHTLLPPADLAPDAGFGSGLLASHELVVASTVSGEPFFYAPVPTSWKHWEPIDGPDASRVLALYGNEVLVEQPGSDDLAFFAYEAGTWTPTGTLPGARNVAATWVFDPVAAFAVTERSAIAAGAVERWVRTEGVVDASVAFTAEHTGLTAVLHANQLFVGEPTPTGGQVHVFDWTADRAALFAELGGHHEEVCQYVEESSLALPFAFDDGTYSGDIDANTSAFFRTVVQPGMSVDFELTSPFTGAGAFDLDVTDAAGVMIDSGAGRMVDGVQRRRWDNFGATPLELYVELSASSNDLDRTCRAFDFTATPIVQEPDYCESAAASTELIDVVGYEMKLRGSSIDVFGVDLFPDRRMRVSIQHELSPRDIKIRLRDEDGNLLSFGGGDVILRTATQVERVYVEVEFVDRAPGVCGTYVLDVDLTTPDP